MKALSIKQPWAWLIATGRKDIENRTWPTKYRGRFFIHASKTFDKAAVEWLKLHWPHDYHDMMQARIETGGIVGVATIKDCVTYDESPWFEGPFGFRVCDATSIPYVSCPGQLGFFDIDEAWVRQQLQEPAQPTGQLGLF